MLYPTKMSQIPRFPFKSSVQYSTLTYYHSQLFILWNHLISWAQNFVIWRRWTCLWTLEFVEFKIYEIFCWDLKFVIALPMKYTKINVQQIKMISHYNIKICLIHLFQVYTNCAYIIFNIIICYICFRSILTVDISYFTL